MRKLSSRCCPLDDHQRHQYLIKQHWSLRHRRPQGVAADTPQISWTLTRRLPHGGGAFSGKAPPRSTVRRLRCPLGRQEHRGGGLAKRADSGRLRDRGGQAHECDGVHRGPGVILTRSSLPGQEHFDLRPKAYPAAGLRVQYEKPPPTDISAATSGFTGAYDKAAALRAAAGGKGRRAPRGIGRRATSYSLANVTQTKKNKQLRSAPLAACKAERSEYCFSAGQPRRLGGRS